MNRAFISPHLNETLQTGSLTKAGIGWASNASLVPYAHNSPALNKSNTAHAMRRLERGEKVITREKQGLPRQPAGHAV